MGGNVVRRYVCFRLQAVLAAVLCMLVHALVVNPPACADQPDLYKLGPEDVIQVNVVGHPEFSGEFFIPNDGIVSFPRAGEINVSGQSLSEVAGLVTANLRKTLLRPDVTVTLRSARPQTVYVTGSVLKPGSFDLKPGWRVSEAIGAAGGLVLGITPADCTVSVLTPSGTRSASIAYQDALSGDESKNPRLAPGDLVLVDCVNTFPVYVMGRVNRPGVYNMREDSAGVLEAITAAGGLADDAALSRVTVTHVSGESETISLLPVTTEGKQPNVVKLRSGDLVVVPDSGASFAVLGWVNAPGTFAMKENQSVTLSDAIGLARGVDNRRGGLGQVAILRTVDGKQQRLVYDLAKFAKRGDSTQNPEIKPDDVVWVPETRKPNWDQIFSRLSSGLSVLWWADRWSK